MERDASALLHGSGLQIVTVTEPPPLSKGRRDEPSTAAPLISFEAAPLLLLFSLSPAVILPLAAGELSKVFFAGAASVRSVPPVPHHASPGSFILAPRRFAEAGWLGSRKDPACRRRSRSRRRRRQPQAKKLSPRN